MSDNFVEIIPEEEWENTSTPKAEDDYKSGDAIFEHDNSYLDIPDSDNNDY